ncbi:MAG: N-acetylmuramoyl-L-alanine amidase [Lachnospiraceae bacterium]|nr:N-acetylmuramoyl-L-alanine amidase [Lachnospiraceae bacterium]
MTYDIYSLYKRLLVAAVIFTVMITGLTAAYMLFFHPETAVPQRYTGAAEDASGSESAYAPAGAEGAGALKPGANKAAESEVSVESVSEPVNELFLDGTSTDTDYLWIPVADGITGADIVIENHYMEHQLWVAIDGGDSSYYKDNFISGDLSGVIRAEADDTPERLIIKFAMDKVYEYETIFENGVLYVDTRLPRELYDRIVVIDPAGNVPAQLLTEGSASPEVICQDIASKVQSGLEDDGIRVYITSADGRLAADEDCLSLASDVRPDMYIRIETSYDEDSKVYGTETVYNGTYFIPGFGSVELADLLEANVTTYIGGKAVGLVAAGENDGVIAGATVPAASVRVGYYTNSQENILLNRDDYRTRIAEGILAAVREAYGE